MFYVSEVLYIAALTLVKASMLVFYVYLAILLLNHVTDLLSVTCFHAQMVCRH